MEINFRQLESQPDLVVEKILMNLDRQSILSFCDTSDKMKEKCVKLPKKMWKWLIIRDCFFNESHAYKWTFKEYKKCDSQWIPENVNWLMNCAMFNDLELFKVLFKNKEYYTEDSLYFCLENSDEEIKNFLKRELFARSDDVAMTVSGMYYYGWSQYKDATKMFRKAIKRGNGKAMTKLGVYYEEQKENYNKAKKYYEMGVAKGDGEAYGLLGLYFKDFNEDEKKAKEYYQKGIDKGDSGSMVNMADLLIEIEDRKEGGKFDKAFKYYERAASLGNCDAIESLAGIYENRIMNDKLADKYKKLANDCEENKVSKYNLPKLLKERKVTLKKEKNKYPLITFIKDDQL